MIIQKGIRGAITVEENTADSIAANTRMLLEQLISDNQLSNEDMVSVLFTATADLTKVYPAKVAREFGLSDVPLMCLQEMYVEESLEKCLRVLITINCKPERKITHSYLKEAVRLRPDLSEKD